MVMRKIILITIILFLSLLIKYLSLSEARGGKKLVNRLTGYIETTFDGAIRKINLPSDKMEEILKKLTNDYYVGSFDISPDGKDRIIEAEQRGDEPDRLIMFSNNTKFKTVVNKNLIRRPVFSPDGKRIAYLYREPGKEPRENCVHGWSLYLINADGMSDNEISNNCLSVTKPSWFPDGKRLSVSTRDFKIYIIDTETDKEEMIVDFGWAPSVSHNGKKIAYLSKEVDDSIKKRMIVYRNTRLKERMIKKNDRDRMQFSKLFLTYSFYIYDIDSGKSKKISDEFWVEQRPIWSPDDRYLLFSDRRAVVDDVYVLDTKTGETEKISSHKGEVMAWRD